MNGFYPTTLEPRILAEFLYAPYLSFSFSSISLVSISYQLGTLNYDCLTFQSINQQLHWVFVLVVFKEFQIYSHSPKSMPLECIWGIVWCKSVFPMLLLEHTIDSFLIKRGVERKGFPTANLNKLNNQITSLILFILHPLH